MTVYEYTEVQLILFVGNATVTRCSKGAARGPSPAEHRIDPSQSVPEMLPSYILNVYIS